MMNAQAREQLDSIALGNCQRARVFACSKKAMARLQDGRHSRNAAQHRPRVLQGWTSASH
jgi:hypothetical protein